jgi:MYXO-CTERM domain-containing protein
MAMGPYALAALVAAFAGWRWSVSRPRSGDGPAERARRRARTARIVAFLVVLFGATLVPLSVEVVWRSQGNAAEHVQPEVVVVERAGARVAHGKTPYRVIDRNGHIVIHERDLPVYELYYPYLPGMIIFGLSSGSTVEARLTDARIQFLLFSVLITILALSRLRPSTDARTRAFQALTVLPTAALPFATGGDDMPVVALMLAGLVALQRRRPVLAGLALGAASSLKFTAWPLVVFALWAAFDRSSRRAIGRYVAGVVAVVVPVVLPVALSNMSAFVDNVIRFPLGLAGVSSPAASALPGHILVSALPGIHRPYLIVAGLVGGVVLIRHLVRHPPRNPAEVAALTGWVMLVAILLAPATRVGYLLYPINLFVWAWMLGQADVPAVGGTVVADGGTTGATVGDRAAVSQFSSSGSWKSSTEYGVMPAEVVGETTTPTSQ